MRQSFAQLDEDQLNTELTSVLGEELVWRSILLLLPLLLSIVAPSARSAASPRAAACSRCSRSSRRRVASTRSRA